MLALICLLTLGVAPAPAPAPAPPVPQRGAGQSHLVVITGLGGESKYREAFHEWASQIVGAAEGSGLSRSNIAYLGEKPERDPDLIGARSTRENVVATLRQLAATAAPADQIVIVLIGHGSYRDGVARVNLPGPDMSAADFAPLLDGFATQKIVFVNAASSSGAFIQALSGPNRIIITATRSGGERYETQFGRYFAEALASDGAGRAGGAGGADLDKDERISVLEAFTFAQREVERYYETDNRLATEHALLDDNGDGEGSDEPGPEAPDGALAGAVYLVSGPASAEQATSDPRLADLYAEKRQLEEEIEALRAIKSGMEASAYEQQLEELLVRFALNARAIRELTEQVP
ncbi:MAG: hypothetical protein V3U63_10200 [Gemmatimonadota bacterium]